PPIDLARMDPLLRRGDLLFVEVAGIALRQTSVATRLSHPEARVRETLLDPVPFTQAPIAGRRATVRERDEDGTLFDWSVDLPLIGTGGSMQLAEAGDRTIHLDATGGALNDGRWRFVTQRLPGGATGVLGWAAFDVGSANFLLRAIVEADASLRPGLSAATELMMARALRIRLMRRCRDLGGGPNKRACDAPSGGARRRLSRRNRSAQGVGPHAPVAVSHVGPSGWP